MAHAMLRLRLPCFLACDECEDGAIRISIVAGENAALHDARLLVSRTVAHRLTGTEIHAAQRQMVEGMKFQCRVC